MVPKINLGDDKSFASLPTVTEITLKNSQCTFVWKLDS